MGLFCIGLPEPIERNHPFNCVQLSSVSELNPTQSNGLSSIGFDLFDKVRLVRKRTHTNFGVRFGSIAELGRTQTMD